MKAKRDGAGPSRCQCIFRTDYCCGAAAGGGVLAGGGVPAGGGLPPCGGPFRRSRMPIAGIFCHFSNCSGVRTSFIFASVSVRRAFALALRSSGVRLVSCRSSRIFSLCASTMACTFGFWSSVKLSWSRLGPPLMPGECWPAGGAPAGGVEGGVLVSSARKAGLHTSKLPAANAAINMVLFAFIIIFRSSFSFPPRHYDAACYPVRRAA